MCNEIVGWKESACLKYIYTRLISAHGSSVGLLPVEAAQVAEGPRPRRRVGAQGEEKEVICLPYTFNATAGDRSALPMDGYDRCDAVRNL